MNYQPAFDQNQASWDKRVAPHLESEMYKLEAFMKGATSLKVPELALMGDVKGLSLLHLQCHFGQDTLSWARKGATVTGVDFSPVAIDKARELTTELDLPAAFVCCNVLDTNEHVPAQFDRVFTSYGTITWLPNVDQWASVVASRLKPGGRFVMVDFHPSMWMLDDDYKSLHYPYWSESKQSFEESGTYADREAEIESTSNWWNHPLSETMTALMDRGLVLKTFQEFDHSVYDCLPGMVSDRPEQYVLPNMGRKIPYMYALVFDKPA